MGPYEEEVLASHVPMEDLVGVDHLFDEATSDDEASEGGGGGGGGGDALSSLYRSFGTSRWGRLISLAKSF